MDIKTRLTRCCGRESEYGQICREGYRCPDCFDKLEGWREIKQLREALKEIAADASVAHGTDKQMWKGWRKIATTRIDIARSALQQKESE